MTILKIIAAVFAGIVLVFAGILLYILIALALGVIDENNNSNQL